MPNMNGHTITTAGDLNTKQSLPTQNLPQPRKGRPKIFQTEGAQGGALSKVNKRLKHRMETPQKEISRFTKKA